MRSAKAICRNTRRGLTLKALSIAVLYFIVAGLTFGECVEVSSRKALPSSGNVRITAILQGQPLAGAALEVSLSEREHIASVRTDAHGVTVLPPLKPGFYSIFGSFGEEWHADLYLLVSESSRNEPSSFSLEFLSVFPDADAAFRAAGTTQVIEKVQEFRGLVKDQSGAGVPGALIKISRRQDGANSKAVTLRTDESGHFSTTLPEGTYTALIHLNGFRTETLVFELARNGLPKELHAVLKVASC